MFPFERQPTCVVVGPNHSTAGIKVTRTKQLHTMIAILGARESPTILCKPYLPPHCPHPPLRQRRQVAGVGRPGFLVLPLPGVVLRRLARGGYAGELVSFPFGAALLEDARQQLFSSFV